MTPTPEDLKRRARAAWGYSLRSQQAVAKDAGINERTIEGLLAQKGPPISVELAWRVATACDVPSDFITYGWDWASDNRDMRERLADLERQVAALSGPAPPANGSTQQVADAFDAGPSPSPDAPRGTGDANANPEEAA